MAFSQQLFLYLILGLEVSQRSKPCYALYTYPIPPFLAEVDFFSGWPQKKVSR